MKRTGRIFKTAAFLCTLLFLLAVMAAPVLAKGGRGFSSGGRAAFSSGGKGFSSGRSFSTGGSGFSSQPAAPKTPPSTGGRSLTSGTSGAGGASGAGGPAGTGGEAAGSSPRKSFSTGAGSFSTPRQGNPPAMYQDYGTGRQSYSTDRPAYGTGRTSYSGGGVPELGRTKYPAKPPVTVFGPAPQPPEYYHNYYWGLPFWARLFFNPYYYWTPWGYHFFAPRLLTWLLLFGLLGLGALYVVSRLRRQ